MAFETVVQENEHDFQRPLESGCFADQQCHQLMIFTGLHTGLKKWPLAVKDHVYVDEQIERALQDYIARMAFPVEAAYQGGGRALVKGFVENQQEADTLVSLLKSNVTGLHTVNLHVRPLDQLRPEWEAILKDSSLADKIILRPQAGHLLAEGTLNNEQRLRWNTAKKAIAAHLGRPADIVEQIQARETLKDIPGKIDIPIAGVTMAPYPFITLQDGKVHFKGACFENGTVINEFQTYRGRINDLQSEEKACRQSAKLEPLRSTWKTRIEQERNRRAEEELEEMVANRFSLDNADS